MSFCSALVQIVPVLACQALVQEEKIIAAARDDPSVWLAVGKQSCQLVLRFLTSPLNTEPILPNIYLILFSPFSISQYMTCCLFKYIPNLFTRSRLRKRYTSVFFLLFDRPHPWKQLSRNLQDRFPEEERQNPLSLILHMHHRTHDQRQPIE